MGGLVSFSFAAAAALLGAAGVCLLADGRFEARLTAHLSGEEVRGGPRLRRPDLKPLLRGLIRVGERAGRGALEADKAQALRQQLIQAGFYSERAPQVFFGVRAVGALVLGVLALLAGLLLGQRGVTLLLTTGMGANLGLFGPNIWLRRRIGARALALRLALPDVVDLMVVTVEAGAALSAALQRVTAEFSDLYPIVQEQFGVMLMEMQAGASRAQALTRLAARSPSDEVAALVSMLIQSEAIGASVGGTLRAFSQELRKSRHLEAERKAAELPVKIAFPLVFCIFPAMSDVLFSPVVIHILHSSFFHPQ